MMDARASDTDAPQIMLLGPAARRRRASVLAIICLGLSGCGSASPPERHSSALRAVRQEARPIGRGPRFHEPVTGRVHGSCRSRLGPRADAHVEVFAANRVVLIPAGIGVHVPVTRLDGRITSARCYGDVVTLDPTGIVLVRRGTRVTLRGLFSGWGQPLSRTRLAAFPAGTDRRVRIYVDGRQRRGAAAAIPLKRHAEIVLEVGPYVRPHSSFTFEGGSTP
jgi:hypothetical protein